MKTLRDFADVMTWTLAGRRQYELHAGGDVVATLRWPNGFGAPAQGETSDGRLVIERSGLLRPRLLVQREASARPGREDGSPASQAAPLITLELDFGGRGLATSQAGKRFDWVPKNLWRTTWAFEAEGRPIVTFQTDSALKFGHKAKIGTENNPPELESLMLLGSAVGVYLTEDAGIFGV